MTSAKSSVCNLSVSASVPTEGAAESTSVGLPMELQKQRGVAGLVSPSIVPVSVVSPLTG